MGDATRSAGVHDLASIFARRGAGGPRPAASPVRGAGAGATLTPVRARPAPCIEHLANDALSALRGALRRGAEGLLDAEIAVRTPGALGVPPSEARHVLTPRSPAYGFAPSVVTLPSSLRDPADLHRSHGVTIAPPTLPHLRDLRDLRVPACPSSLSPLDSGPSAPAAAPPPSAPPVPEDVFLAPVLLGDYDALGRLVVEAGWLLPEEGGRAPRLVRPAQATPEAVLEGGFGEDEAGLLRLLEAVPEPLRASFSAPPQVFEGDAIPDALARLRAQAGFHAAPRVRSTRVSEEAPRLERLALVEDAPGWLELDVRYRSGAHSVSLGDVLAASGARYLRVGDDFVPVPRGALIDEARAHSGTKAPPTLPALAILRAIAREPERPSAEALSHAGPAARALAAIAAGREPGPAPEPVGYTGALRPHQRQGLDWLWSLREAHLGGILADEMGLGKTHMTLALVAAARASGATRPSLVVTPTSVLDAWIDRAREFAPGLTTVRYFGAEREALLENLEGGHIIVTTYGILVRDIDRLSAQGWEIAALDEAHRIKNPDTEASRAARRLTARTRLAITGTPVENRPGEVRALLEYAVPGYLPSAERFEAIERAVMEGDAEAVEHLRRLVHPFKLRRRKKDVLHDLPDKLEETRFCELTDEQAALYREVLAEAKHALKSGPSLVSVLAALTRLKRLCDHPSLVLPDGRGKDLPSGKLALLEEILVEAARLGRKVVVFSQYLEMLDLIEGRARALGLAFEDLRGSTRDRAGAIRRFQADPAVRLMCVSLLAGGVGIDLTAGDVVVHYDRWWNAAREDQATDRVHRIGQTKEVRVLRLVTRGTLEERIDAIIAKKARLLDDVVAADDPALARTLGREELTALLDE